MDNPFWQFSLKLYASKGVQNVCLQLQTQYGLNVNLLLWSCWLAEQDLLLDAQVYRQAQQSIEFWQRQYVEPLRLMRQQLKDHAATTLRAKIMSAELEAERTVQDRLYTFATEVQMSMATNALKSNVDLCLRSYAAQSKLSEVLSIVTQ